ncbi:carboxylesterase/lipase family protein [Nocardioides mangrovicus]|uniref:carboxylesterase/lipase family protein n=1 Tax=Nocardioides mangrovicus TaxID=2478913 RepID=UPI001E3BECE1|nr:carboxylesterase family protein [Nocardioides mangrovicus]
MTEVSTRAGRVRGSDEGEVAVFRGIPFARRPTGELRFQRPVPCEPWDDVLDTTSFGPPPPQSQQMGPAPDDDADRSWLTANVWTTDVTGRRPVLVYVYGGAYRSGHAGDPAYDGTLLATEGEVVVVTFNHRVGAEGYAQIEGAPANRGLLDCLAALAWVRDNIESFGGDPAQVSVFGESAGAGAIASLLAMPQAHGLFGRAVLQSIPGTFFSAELAADIATTVAGSMGRTATAEDLAEVAPADLVAAFDALVMPPHAARWGNIAFTPTPFSPVVDGEVLPVTPWQAVRDGSARDVEILVGHNRDEFRLFVMLGGLLGNVTPELEAQTLALFSPDPAGFASVEPDALTGRLFELVQSDWLFRMPSLRLAQEQSRAGGRVHLYELTWAAPAAPLGACHALDVPLVWGSLSSGFATMLIGDPVPDEAVELSRELRGRWTAFARTGDPGWPVYDDDAQQCLVIDVESSVERYPEQASAAYWAGHEFAALPLLNDSTSERPG